VPVEMRDPLDLEAEAKQIAHGEQVQKRR